MQASPAPQNESLQFDRADFGGDAPAACAGCQAPLSHTYFEVNGLASCEACAREVQLAANTPLTVSGFLRAAVCGAGAALVGTIVWFAVAKLTGFEVGLIAIVIGVMVGRAVLYGNRGRGAPVLQALAMVLTYASITMSYVPDVAEMLLTKHEAETASATADAAEPADAVAPPAPAAATAADASEAEPSLGRSALALSVFFLVCFAIAAAAPVLAGFENIIGMIIIAIGLYEAWKITRRTMPAVDGPLDLRTPRPAA
jgi:hypothetical protein